MSSHNQAPLKTEFLTVLLPERRADGSEARARKVWCIGPSGSPEALGYDLRRVAFRVEPRPIASLGDAVAIIEKVAAHGRGFWVRGEHVGSRTRFQRRRWRPEPGKPATLDDVPKRLALFDMDGVPNVEGLDPRTEPVRAAEWLAELLGGDFRRAALHVRFSSTGRTVDPRYGYSMSTLRTLLSIGDDECAAAGLISLSPPEIAAHVRRWSATNQCPSQEMAERERAWRRVRRLARSGLSVREISKRADIPVTTVHRMMNSPRPRQLKERFFLRGIEFSVGQVFQVCRHLVIEEEREKEVLAVKRDVAEVIQPASPEEASLRQGGGPAPLGERPRTAGVSATPGNPSDAIRLDGRGKAAIAARTAEAAWAALAEIPDDDERVAVLGVLNALAAERSFLTVRGAAPTKARPTQRIPASIVALRFKSSFAALDTAMRSADEAWLTAIERQAKRHKRTVALLDRWEFGESLRGKSDDEVIELVRRRGVAARTLWFGLSSAALARASKLAGRSLRPRECDDAMKHRRALASVLKADRDEVRRMGLGRQLTARCLEHLWPDAADQARPAVRSEPRLDAVVSPHVALARLRAHAASLST